VTLGPRAGFFACWALFGTYAAFLAANFAEIGLFGESFFSGIGIWDNPDWVIISIVAAALIWLFAYNDIKAVTRSLLGFEAISVALVTILIVIIYVNVIGGDAPNGQDFTLKPFVPASGTTIGGHIRIGSSGSSRSAGSKARRHSERRRTNRVGTSRSRSRSPWPSAASFTAG
jgi:amino acid transporter